MSQSKAIFRIDGMTGVPLRAELALRPGHPDAFMDVKQPSVYFADGYDPMVAAAISEEMNQISTKLPR